MKTKNMTILHLRKSIDRSPSRPTFFLIPLVFACFALSPMARAVMPPPDGSYPGQNTAEGQQALFSLTTGIFNTADGFHALFHDTNGSHNTAVGDDALFSDVGGSNNTATGDHALFSNTIGNNNAAYGYQALFGNDGFDNTAVGYQALYSNTTGSSNTADGVEALFQNDTGNNNIALGRAAGVNLDTGDNNIDIGNGGFHGEANTIRIGTQGTQTNAYIAGIFPVSVPNGLGVVVDSTGHLGTVASSQRFQDEIKPM